MPGISRRRLIGAAAVAAVNFPMVNFGTYRLHAASPKTYGKRAMDVVNRTLVIDMLGVLKISAGPEYYAKRLADRDAADFLASGITGFHVATGIGGPEARERALAFFATWGNFAARNPHVFTAVGNVADLVRAKRDGRCAVIMGLQNAEHFRTVEDVEYFHQIGQRCSQLTYNSQNRIGSGSTERVDGGVTDYGVSVIAAMNKVGMLVDVSHCGPRTTLDAIALSPEPIAFTHTNCRALVDHPRCKTDQAIRALAAKNGVMGITGVRMFVSETEPTAIGKIVDHIDHVVKLVGIDHVGIGSDADLNGYDDMDFEKNKRMRGNYKDSYAFREKIDTDGFDHPLKIYDLAAELIRRRYSDANIAAVLGGNFQRLLTSTWGG